MHVFNGEPLRFDAADLARIEVELPHDELVQALLRDLAIVKRQQKAEAEDLIVELREEIESLKEELGAAELEFGEMEGKLAGAKAEIAILKGAILGARDHLDRWVDACTT